MGRKQGAVGDKTRQDNTTQTQTQSVFQMENFGKDFQPIVFQYSV